MFLTNFKAMVILVACSLIMLFSNFLDPIFSPELKDEYGIKERYIGFISALPFFMYAVCCPFVTWLLTKTRRSVIILVAFFLCSFALILVGPSETLHIPRNLWVLITGYAILGGGTLFFFIPSLPEIIHNVKIKNNIDHGNEMINDKASGVYNSFFSLGAVIAPILAGALKI